jgi:hypothetical protein
VANGGSIDQQSLDREKWANEVEIRKLELELKRDTWSKDVEIRNRELDLKRHAGDAELELKRKEMDRLRWNNPVVVAILAAAIAGILNIIVTSVNDYFQRETETVKAAATEKLERGKAESARILEMIKTGNLNDAARNLQFLVDSGLVSDSDLVNKIKASIITHGSPVLPATTSIQISALPNPPNVNLVNLVAPLPQGNRISKERQ